MNRRRNVRPLLLERLEDRTLLSTYTVNGLGDAGSGLGLAGDLRYCVNLANANPGSTIQFGVTGAINLGSGLTISSNLTITGPGASSVAVKGGGSSSNFSVFTVNNSGVTASISGLTISNGNASFGGGVNNAGNLTLTNDRISGNSAQDGAGVYNSGTATLTNDTISGNSASYYGGGVCNDYHGTATLTNDTISGNSASYYGGGVCNDYSGTATLTNDTISGNSAYDGGGVDNDGTVALTNVTLSGNSAQYGGGVCNDYHGTATLTNDTISGNSAYDGGGVYNYYGTATLINDTLSGNSAYGSGGGLYNYSGTATLTNDTISGNSASYYGGGVYNDYHGTVTLTNDTISGNSASYYGGGVCNDYSGRATLTNDTISGNSADSVGGGVDNDGTATLTNVTLSGNSAYDGGGVCNDYHGTATLTNDTLSGNSAQYGGGVYNYYGTATLINDTLSGNSAYERRRPLQLRHDVTLSGNWSSTDKSGGIYNDSGPVELYNTIVAGNYYGSSGSIPGDVVGTLDPSSAYNLIGTGGSGGLTNTNGNQVGVSNPGLAPLADYGGATQTFALLPGSPAIDAGAASISGVTIPTTDQRGLGRVGNVDIGAFESQGFTLAVASGSTPQSAYVNATFANPLVVTVTANNGSEPVDGGVVTFLAPGSGPSATLSATTATIAAGATSVTAMANGTAGGPYTVTASAAGAGQVGFALTNLSRFVQPVFSNLAAPTITYGTSTVTLSGTIAAGSSIPTGSVAITVGGMTAPATIGGDGSFSAVFDTHALVVAGSPYTVSYDFAASGNFLGCSGTSSLTITPATLDVSVSAVNISYGTALVDTQLSGSASEAGTPVAGTFAYDPSVVGTVLHANVAPQSEPVIFTPTDTTDYNTVTATASIYVSKAILSIGTVYDSLTYGTTLGSAINPTTVYDANSHAVTGTFDFVESGSADVTDSVLDVGHYGLSVTFNPTDTTDYSSVTTTASIDITQAKIAIVADSPTITYGDSPTLTNTLYTDLGPDPNNPSVDDYQELDSTALASVAYTSALGSAPAATTDAILSAGDHTINPTDISTLSSTTARSEFLNNFDVVYGPGTLTVTPATLDVTADAQTKVYGQADPTLTYVATGFQFSDNEASVLTGALSRAAGEDVASYAIGQGTLAANSDYTISFTGNSLTITPATLSVAADAQTKVYGQADPTLTYVATGFQFSDNEASVLTGALSRAAGEDVASYAIGQGTLAANSDYTISFTGNSLTITPATLSVAADAQTKVYGQADPALTYVATGFQFSDNEASVLTGALSRAAGEDVASYAIGQGTLAANSDYTISFTGNSLTITPATLSVAADAQTKVYGQADPTLTYVATGFQFSDNEASVLTGALSRAAGEDVASYAIGQGTLAANSDYTISFTGNSLTITPATLSVAADAQTKVYGQADPTLTYVATGFQFSDNEASVLTGALSRAAGEDVASYAIGQGTLAANSDYTISFTGNSLTITPATLSVAADAQTKVYGQADPTLTYVATGFQFSDNEASVLTGALSRAAGEDVASYAIGQGTLAANSDYTISFTGNSLTITPATLSVAADAQTKVYGQADPTLTYVATGFQFSDNEASVLTGALSRAAGEDVASYAIGQGTLAANSDYTISFTGNSLTITPATLSVAADAQTKVYGQADPALTFVATGFQFSDNEASVLTGALSRAAGEDVASYAIGQGTLAANSDYTISFTGNSLTITPATLSVAADAQTKVYGQADPALTYVATGFQFSDNEASVLTGALSRAAGEDVASYAIGQGTLAANSDYTISFTGNSLTITPATLSVAADAQTKVYGQADPALTYVATGFQFSDNEASVLTGALSRAAGEDVASYAIGQGTLAANSDYTISFTGNSLTITPATLSVAADAQTKVYGQADPALTYVATGFQFSDNEASVLTGALSRAAGEDVASYAIGQGTLAANSDYTISFTGNSLTITPATLSVAADAQTKVYGQADPALTFVATGFQFSDNEASVLTGALSRAAGEDVASYAIGQGTLAANSDYTISFTGNSLTITPATLSVAADAQTKVYGQADPALTYRRHRLPVQRQRGLGADRCLEPRRGRGRGQLRHQPGHAGGQQRLHDQLHRQQPDHHPGHADRHG